MFVAAERLAHRDVDRYYLESDPRKVVWIDQQTNIPLLIMEGEQASLSVTNYRFDSGDTQQYRYVELELGGEGFLANSPCGGGFCRVGSCGDGDHRGNLTNTLTFRNWNCILIRWAICPSSRLGMGNQFGETAYNLGQWEDVIASFTKVVDIDPYYLPGYFFLAHAFYFMDNYFGAVENLQQGLMLQPDNALLLNNLAYIYMERRVNLGEAVRMAEQAVAQSRRAVYLDTLGYGYFLLGQYDLAQAILEEALAAVDESVSPESRGEIELHLEMVYHALEGD